MTLALPAIPSLLAACLVLIAGGVLTQRVPLFARYSIPAPIVGGVLFAIATLITQRMVGLNISLDTPAKTPLLLMFFASIGLTADITLLKRGGVRLLRLLIALFPFLVAQDALGVLMARLLGLHPVMGLVAGSITLVGGHATGAAYAERFAEDYDIMGVMGLTMTSATLGLVIGGILGGPVAERLLRRNPHALATRSPALSGGVVGGPISTPVTAATLVTAMASALAAVLVGEAVSDTLSGAPFTVPTFLLCLLAALVLRNGATAISVRLPDAAAELIGSVCLSLFLAWTMMELDLTSIFHTAGPLLIILAVQTLLMVAWARFVMFRAVGGDYESAVLSGAFCGFAMGTTATAIANMQALTRRHGPAPQAFIVVPLVGAFFIDLMNLAVLTAFLSVQLVTG
jgi:ESS family glutamate:Na+ symporter